MSEEKMSVQLDTDPQIARLIMDYASYLQRSIPKEMVGQPDSRPNIEDGQWIPAVRLNEDHVKEAANLVFLALSLIAKKRQ